MIEGSKMPSQRENFDKRDGTGGTELVLRNHITYIVEKAWKVILLLLAVLIGNTDLDEVQLVLMALINRQEIEENMQIYLIWFCGGLFLFLLLAIWYLIRWYRTTMVVKEGTITYVKNTLTRKSNTMSVKQISNVNMEQNIFEMIFGTCKMRLDTDSLSTADETDMEIILKKKRAEQVKKLILTMKEGGEENFDSVEEQETEEIYDVTYSVKEMILNGLLSITVAQFLVAVGVVLSFIGTLGMILEDVAHGKFDVTQLGGLLFLLLSEFVASYSIISAMLKKILQDFRFRARRENDQIYVSCGLWKKKSYMVPINKINAVKIEYPLIARIFGRGYLRVLNVGGEAEEVDGMKLLLIGTYDELKERMNILLPEYIMPDLKKRKKAPRQWLYIRGISSVILGLFIVAASYIGILAFIGYQGYHGEELKGMVGFCCLVGGMTGMLLWFFLSFLTYKTYGIGYMERELLLIHGTFKKEVSLIPYEKIQYICYSQGPLERFFGLQHGYVSLLASLVSRYRHMGSFPIKDFEMLEEKLRDTY